MTRPRYSEMLVERRRSLGLSVKQAAQVLKLKEQVLVAFEEGDFENMPEWFNADDYDYDAFAEKVFEETALPHRPN